MVGHAKASLRLLTDDAWGATAPIFTSLPHKAGSPPELRDCHCQGIEAALDCARTSLSWRDLPEEFGPGETVDNGMLWRETRHPARQLHKQPLCSDAEPSRLREASGFCYIWPRHGA